jgi:hypothetical protein
MKLTAALRARLSGSSGSELEQAIVRIGLLLVVTLNVWSWVSVRVPPVSDHDKVLRAGSGRLANSGNRNPRRYLDMAGRDRTTTRVRYAC